MYPSLLVEKARGAMVEVYHFPSPYNHTVNAAKGKVTRRGKVKYPSCAVRDRFISVPIRSCPVTQSNGILHWEIDDLIEIIDRLFEAVLAALGKYSRTQFLNSCVIVRDRHLSLDER